VAQERGEGGAANGVLVWLGLAIFLSMNVLVFTMALWTQDVYGTAEAGADLLPGVLRGLFRYLGLLFALPVLFLLGGPLAANAWAELRRGRPTTDVLLLLGVAASFIYSAVSVIRDEGPVYFEIGCAVLVLVTLGRWLEATGKLRTTAALDSLQRLVPERVRILRGPHETEVPLEAVCLGDHLHVLPGERIPCDGQVLNHSVTVDEQVVTGESAPAVKEPGERIFGGSLNLDGDLTLTVTATAHEGVLARIMEHTRAAQRAKGRYERLADRVAGWFLPLVLVAAVAATLWQVRFHGPAQGILTGLAVVLIACPCALGLATPMAVWGALGAAARAQVLFRNGEALERLAEVRAVRLDKTGTLTTGTPSVATFTASAETNRDEVLHLAACLAAGSTHSYSLAIRRYAEQEGILTAAGPEFLQEVRTLPGRGLRARSTRAGRDFYLGSLRHMQEADVHCGHTASAAVDAAMAAGRPLACIGWDGHVRGVFTFCELVRSEAAEAVARLRGEGLDVAVLTGDSAARAAALGRELGVAVAAELLPEDKVAALDTARRAVGAVAMVGDGINDAPALAASDVGIALGCGTDLARETAAVCLLGNDLLRLPWAIALARRTVRSVRQNLFWAFAYNLVGIAFACTGKLNPVLAALAMVLSSLLVVTNSLRLGGVEGQEPEPLAGPFRESPAS
jgi:heavy metal translocating P-type ATPase